ncbi:MarR family transcriptional regulator [Cellulosimicrobium funkei]|nr:MarR family transcriptional regulator [Cellulosimicrobium funkei]
MDSQDDRDRALRRIETLTVAIAVRSLPHIVGTLLDTSLTIKQLKVLSLLAGPRPLTLSNLGAEFEVSLATMSGIVDKLVQRDLVHRIPLAGDQRVRLLELTSLGRTVVSEILAPRPYLGSQVLAGLDVTELAALEVGLAAVNRALERGSNSPTEESGLH